MKYIFTMPPINIIDNVPITIDLIMWIWIIFFNISLGFWLRNKDIWFRKYQIIAQTLPNCNIAETDNPGSSTPRKIDTILRWAVLLIGKNSVKPWIKP